MIYTVTGWHKSFGKKVEYGFRFYFKHNKIHFISNYFVPVVMAGCLATGYVVKKWIKDVDNKWIPTVVFFEGAALNCIVSGNVTVETVVAGAVCGLASTGLHQAFTRIIENKKEE